MDLVAVGCGKYLVYCKHGIIAIHKKMIKQIITLVSGTLRPLICNPMRVFCPLFLECLNAPRLIKGSQHLHLCIHSLVDPKKQGERVLMR